VSLLLTQLSTGRTLTGAIVEAADVASGNLAVAIKLSGAIVEASDVSSGTLKVAVNLTGALVEANDTSSGVLAVAIRLSGALVESGDVFDGAIAVSGSVAVVVAAVRRGAAYPGGWVPDRLYTPPRKRVAEEVKAELRELYREALEIVPESEQIDLLPARFQIGTRAATLPPVAEVDFDKLSRSLRTIQNIVAAVSAARDRSAESARIEAVARIKDAQRAELEDNEKSDDETIMVILAELL
jgi:hypothetical protein